MKYIDKYPPPPKEFKAADDKQVEPQIWQTPRYFQCLVCGVRTGFRFTDGTNPGSPCCSSECRDVMAGWEAEAAREEIAARFNTGLESSPSSSPVEQSLDTGEVEGSTPSLGTE